MPLSCYESTSEKRANELQPVRSGTLQKTITFKISVLRNTFYTHIMQTSNSFYYCCCHK